MTDYNGRTIGDKAFGNFFRFAIITSIITHIEHQLLTGDTALGIDCVDGGLRPMHHLFAKHGILPAHGASNADGDIGAGRCCAEQ